MGELDHTSCPDGYQHITEADKCATAAQYLKIQPSDTDGDGKSVALSDTDALKKWVQQRVIAEDSFLGNMKPYGCYRDQSIRIVNGDVIKNQQEQVITVWVNLNEKQSGKHDNSQPICESTCPLHPPTTTITTTTITTTTTTTLTTTTTTTDPCRDVPSYKLMAKDTDPLKLGCPKGYAIITDVKHCISGAQYLDSHPGLTNGMSLKPSDTNGDGHTVDLHNTTEMLPWMRRREIKDLEALGNKKPFGCYADQSIRIVKGAQKLITTLWVNHNRDGSGKHDNSAPICISTCGGGSTALPVPALFDVSHKGKAEEFHKGNGLAEQNPVTSVLTNGVLFITLASVFGLVARSLRQRFQLRPHATFNTIAQHDQADDEIQEMDTSRSARPLLRWENPEDERSEP